MGDKEPNQASEPARAPVRNAKFFVRLTAIGALLAVIVGLFLYAGGWFTPRALTPAALVNLFEHIFGVHSGFRRNHAKGVCITGFFDGNGQGRIPPVLTFAKRCYQRKNFRVGHHTLGIVSMVGVEQSREQVVTEALKALDRHGGLVIPGVINKSAAFAERLIPRSVIAKLVARPLRPGPAS